jgi:hypothetical protein
MGSSYHARRHLGLSRASFLGFGGFGFNLAKAPLPLAWNVDGGMTVSV